MSYKQLLGELKAVEFREVRAESGEMFEAVLTKYHLDRLTGILDRFFGQPLKPEGEHPGSRANALADPYGGIRSNQTLYHTESEEIFILAMLWPWMDGVSITLKVFTGKCGNAPAAKAGLWQALRRLFQQS